MTKRKRKVKPPLSFPEACIRGWEETGDLTPLGMLADWLESEDRNPELAESIRWLLGDRSRAPAVRFFWDHAGCSYAPDRETKAEGQLSGAVRLALAERWADENDIRPRWVQDEDYDPNDYDYPGTDDDGNVIPIGWGCVLECECEECEGMDSRDKPHKWCASLWSITFGGDGYPEGDPYKRLVEAELASELMPDN